MNRGSDVQAVQDMLNRHVRRMGLTPLVEDGHCGPRTLEAIRRFQVQVMGLRMPDARVDPDGRTLRALGGPAGGLPAPVQSMTNYGTGKFSGAEWWRAHQGKWPNRNSLDVLAEPFKTNAIKFVAALRAAGATVKVNDTKRSITRGKLMRNSWDVAKGLVEPNKAPAIEGVDIEWDHGDLAASRRAAAEMVALFGIKKQPSYTSNHYKGLAIDMTISWTGILKIKSADGRTSFEIGAPRNGTNAKLHEVGATYKVYHKLPDDPPHWSVTGR